jgi:hypothetical protein
MCTTHEICRSDDLNPKSTVNPNKKYLDEIINTFVVPRKRTRFAELVSSSRRYQDFLNEIFIDQRNLDPACIHELPKEIASDDAIADYLTKVCSSNSVYVLSEDLSVDGLVTNLETISRTQVGRHVGILLYVIRDRWAYFEDSETTKLLLQPKPSR